MKRLKRVRDGWGKLVFIGVIILGPAAGLAAAQEGGAQTMQGCLVRGDGGGFALVDEVTGRRVTIRGTGLDAALIDSRIQATGTLTGPDGGVFEATAVEQVREGCGPIGFSLAALRDEIGRARVGARAGVGLDPETILLGGQAHLGPIVRNIWFRPTTEFAFGEVTSAWSIHGDFAYYLPFVSRGPNQEITWTTYVGGGPNYTLLRRNFEGFPDQPVEVDADWNSEAGVSVFFGAQRASGLFVELRGSAYTVPTVRLYVGYVLR